MLGIVCSLPPIAAAAADRDGDEIEEQVDRHQDADLVELTRRSRVVAGGQGVLQAGDLEVRVGGGGVAGAEDDVVAGLLPADAEGVRDAMLAVSGELNSKMEGPGVIAPLEKEVKDLIFTEAEVVDLWPVDRDATEHARRSLYLFRKRNVRYAMFDAFDAPDTQSACPRRVVSTHALQALALLNSDFAAGRAKALAGRILHEDGDIARVTLAYKAVPAVVGDDVPEARRVYDAIHSIPLKEATS